MKKLTILAILVCGAAMAGCDGSGRGSGLRPPPPVVDVQGFTLSTSPTALNWDEDPAPDGVFARVQFFQLGPNDQVRSVPVKGTLEFLLYEGRVAPADLAKAKPIYTWTYQADELATYLGKQMGMWAYQMQLDWRPTPPKSAVVTLIARWQAPRGEWQYSDPTLVAVTLK